MIQFLKIKCLIILKINFNGGQFYKKFKILVITKNCKFFSFIKFEIENGENLRWKFWVENFEWVYFMIMSKYLAGNWVGGWVDGWVEKLG